jgi:hypothetical protein
MPAVFQAVKLAVKSYNAHVVIVSDANEMFIRALLARYEMEDYVAEIYANGAHWEDAASARLRITPHHAVEDEPHGCPSGCPRNLCKGTYRAMLLPVRATGGQGFHPHFPSLSCSFRHGSNPQETFVPQSTLRRRWQQRRMSGDAAHEVRTGG